MVSIGYSNVRRGTEPAVPEGTENGASQAHLFPSLIAHYESLKRLVNDHGAPTEGHTRSMSMTFVLFCQCLNGPLRVPGPDARVYLAHLRVWPQLLADAVSDALSRANLLHCKLCD